MKKSLYIVFILVAAFQADAQSIVGQWKSIDDNTGKPRSVVEVYQDGDLFYGKIVKLFRAEGEEQNPMCEECKGEKKGQPIIGMQIISDMKYDKRSNEYVKGEIMDPENGNTYDCKIWLDEDGNLKVRGYVAFFYRTQTWLPLAGG